MRHARIEFGKGQPKMADRHITPEGAKWAKITLQYCHRELALNPDWIISSPLLRARETASIAASAFRKTARVAFDDCLLGEGDVKGVYRRLRKLNRDDSVLLVSHQPLIDKLIGDLLGGDSNIGIYSGAVVCVQCDSYPAQSKGMLVWLVPPRMFFDGKKWPT